MKNIFLILIGLLLASPTFVTSAEARGGGGFGGGRSSFSSGAARSSSFGGSRASSGSATISRPAASTLGAGRSSPSTVVIHHDSGGGGFMNGLFLGSMMNHGSTVLVGNGTGQPIVVQDPSWSWGSIIFWFCVIGGVIFLVAAA